MNMEALSFETGPKPFGGERFYQCAAVGAFPKLSPRLLTRLPLKCYSERQREKNRIDLIWQEEQL